MIELLSSTGLGSSLVIALGLAAILTAARPRKVEQCANGQADTPKHSQRSPLPHTAEPATYAASQAQQQPTTSPQDHAAAPTRSATFAQLTAAATHDAATEPSNGSGNATPHTCYTPNSQPASGRFFSHSPLETSRRPVHFFPTNKKQVRP